MQIDPQEREFAKHRGVMIERQLKGRDITDQRVLGAMQNVRRHEFVPEEWHPAAYTDRPLPIGQDQTISQPYIVALMTQLVQPTAGARALDVGTGSGYQAAVLAEVVAKVYSIEILCPLANKARDRLKTLGYKNVEVRCGDGYRGWPEHAPFDVMIVAAAPDLPDPRRQPWRETVQPQRRRRCEVPGSLGHGRGEPILNHPAMTPAPISRPVLGPQQRFQTKPTS